MNFSRGGASMLSFVATLMEKSGEILYYEMRIGNRWIAGNRQGRLYKNGADGLLCIDQLQRK